MRSLSFHLLAAFGLALGACGDSQDTRDTTPPDTADTSDATTTPDAADDAADTTTADVEPETEAPYVIATKPSLTSSDLGDGVTRAVVDATDEAVWVQLALASASQITTEGGWDLAFQRIQIHTAHPIAAVDEAFETVTKAPADGYVEDGETLAFEQLGEWWNYDLQHHTVSPKVRTFIVKLDAEIYYKLAVRDYYDDAGTTGIVTLDWAVVAKP